MRTKTLAREVHDAMTDLDEALTGLERAGVIVDLAQQMSVNICWSRLMGRVEVLNRHAERWERRRWFASTPEGARALWARIRSQ